MTLLDRAMPLYKKWSKTDFFNSSTSSVAPPSKYDQYAIAMLLETQERASTVQQLPAPFANNIYSLIRETYARLPLRSLVSIQPMLTPTDSFDATEFKFTDGVATLVGLEDNTVSAIHRNLDIAPLTEDDLKGDDWLPTVASMIAEETTQSVLRDIKSNVGARGIFDLETLAFGGTYSERYESLYVKLVEFSNGIHAKTLRGPANWIMAGRDLCELLTSRTTATFVADSLDIHIRYLGTIHHRWRLYYNPAFEANEALLGYKGDNYFDAGYFFNPMQLIVPVVLSDGQIALMQRAGRRLLPGGKHYAHFTAYGIN